MVSKAKCHLPKNDKTKSTECLLPFSSVFPPPKNVKMKVHRTAFFLLFYAGVKTCPKGRKQTEGVSEQTIRQDI
jgi:hypothetical protein